MFRLNDLLVLFPLALVARILFALVRPPARAPIVRLMVDALFLTYLFALGQVVLGFTRLGGLDTAFSPWANVNLIPLGSISELRDPALRADVTGQVVGNVLLFVPLGMLLPLVTPRFRTFKSVFAAGLLLSAGIELAQLTLLLARLMDRAADVDDVILNTLGAVLGYAIWALLFGSSRKAGLRRETGVGSKPEAESGPA